MDSRYHSLVSDIKDIRVCPELKEKFNKYLKHIVD